jgi:hypothetical protein
MGQTLLMLATHCFPQPPDAVKTLKNFAKAVRRPRRSEMSRKNRNRLDQFNDPATLSRLLNLPNTMMKEALAMRADDLASAARHARTAIFFAIECRIPLRIKNLHAYSDEVGR